jgi:hypothetical protein
MLESWYVAWAGCEDVVVQQLVSCTYSITAIPERKFAAVKLGSAQFRHCLIRAYHFFKSVPRNTFYSTHT